MAYSSCGLVVLILDYVGFFSESKMLLEDLKDMNWECGEGIDKEGCSKNAQSDYPVLRLVHWLVPTRYQIIHKRL